MPGSRQPKQRSVANATKPNGMRKSNSHMKKPLSR
jgi:hypothetical protein